MGGLRTRAKYAARKILGEIDDLRAALKVLYGSGRLED